MTQITRAEDVANEIAARLALVLADNGAETNLGAAVYHGRRRVDDEMIPCAVIIEGEDRPDDRVVGADVSVEQRYVLFAYVPCDPANPNLAAHAAIRDLKRAVFLTAGKPDRYWGRKVRGVRYHGRDIGPRGDGAAFVLAAIEIGVSYVENLAAP